MKSILIKLTLVFCTIIFISGCATQGPYFKLDNALTRDIRAFHGAEYVPLVRICDVYKFQWKYDELSRQVSVEHRGSVIDLMVGSDRIRVNGVERKLDRDVIMENGAVMVPVSFARSGIAYILKQDSSPAYTPVEAPSSAMIKTVIIDPGHGGKDPGAVGRTLKLKEKDLTLSIARRLRGLLEENGIRVVMTRDSDTFVALKKRADIANRTGADLLVSIHINAARNRRVQGFECYYLSNATDDRARAVEALENSSLNYDEDSITSEKSHSLEATIWDMRLTENRIESSELAKNICDSMAGSSFGRRKVKAARFYVLKHTRIPSVLVELGYISNRYEESKLRDPKFLDRITDDLAQGILDYKKEYERTEGFTR